MSETLQAKWMDRLFQRFASAYGKHWMDMWNGANIEEIKGDWAEYLDGINPLNMKEALDYCIEHKPFPPTLPEFKILCKQLHKTDVTKALPRKFTPEEIERNQQRVHAAVSQLTEKTDYKAWARKILASPKSYHDISVRFAKEALAHE